MSPTFADRLQRLFDAVHPPGGGPYTGAAVIGDLKRHGVIMSAPYLSQLRSGKRSNPSPATMQALADFFGVEVAYFTDDAYYAMLDVELTVLAAMRDEGVQRISARTIGLSPAACQQLTVKIDELRRRENLDS
ncbi:helix-turn-helix domain-containing protein [Mycolicibacterium moriokaense]|uniref:Helix-turn-helix protein n=1 Tax=Mycolicibacterium moriokaense TaxID=39691 RepID=A0A318H537_9MYCO|nr:helix-turn-helix transcriptional regulator [Mycolicibacterium moriokaense]PXW98851.1 helix-turn-helix protein [Mycolicibacterium moriokaense]